MPFLSGAVFGELAALGLNRERTLTMKAASFVIMYRLAGEAISTVLGDHPEVRWCMPISRWPCDRHALLAWSLIGSTFSEFVRVWVLPAHNIAGLACSSFLIFANR